MSTIRPFLLRPLVIVAAAALPNACHERDIGEVWHLGESRAVYPSPSKLPPTAGEDFSIVVPLGADRRIFALVARDALEIGEGARVVMLVPESDSVHYADVSSMGELRIAAGAEVGSVYALGDEPPLFEPSARLHGYVKSAVSPERFIPVRTQAGFLDHVEPYVEEFRWDVHFPSAKGSDRSSASPEPIALDLAPGAFGAVTVGGGSTTRLQSGEYFFDSLTLKPGATLAIDNSRGPVFVWIRRALALGGTLVDYTLEPNVLFGYAGSDPPAISASVRATLVAPEADVVLPKTLQAHSGSFFARRLTVAAGATVELRAFRYDAMPARAALTCPICGRAEEDAARACCDDVGRVRSVAAASSSLCGDECGASERPSSPACRADCEASESEAMAAARVSFRECAARLSSIYAGCERHYGYRPDTCDRLGFARPALTCDDAR